MQYDYHGKIPFRMKKHLREETSFKGERALVFFFINHLLLLVNDVKRLLSVNGQAAHL